MSQLNEKKLLAYELMKQLVRYQNAAQNLSATLQKTEKEIEELEKAELEAEKDSVAAETK